MTSQRTVRIASTLVLATLMATAATSPAFAAAGAAGNIGTFIQNVIDLLNNNVIRGIAILAIIVTGAGWAFGHVDLRRAATVIVGIIVTFGAAQIVDLITGGTGS